MTHPTLRTDLIAGAHPVEADVWLVYDPVSGRQFEIPEAGWRLASAFDGRSVAAIARAEGVERSVVAGFADRMRALGLFGAPSRIAPVESQWTREPVAERFEIEVHPEASFECTGAGTCCEQGYVIPLSAQKAAAVRRAGLRVLGPEVDPVGLVPTQPGQPWSFALDNEEACPFLDRTKRCLIHETAAYPDACRIFPFVFAQWRDTVFASVAHRCACGAFGGRPLRRQKRALEARARLAARVSTVPEVSRIDRRSTVPSAVAVDALIGATKESSAFAMLRRAASSLGAATGGLRRRRAPGATLFLELVERADDAFVEAALLGARHPQSRDVRRTLRPLRSARGDRPDEDRALANEEATRFVRDHLFGLRPYHYASLADGLGALALAAHRIVTGLPRREVALAARERVMLWEEALTTDAMPRLMNGRLDMHAVAAQIDALDPERA